MEVSKNHNNEDDDYVNRCYDSDEDDDRGNFDDSDDQGGAYFDNNDDDEDDNFVFSIQALYKDEAIMSELKMALDKDQPGVKATQESKPVIETRTAQESKKIKATAQKSKKKRPGSFLTKMKSQRQKQMQKQQGYVASNSPELVNKKEGKGKGGYNHDGANATTAGKLTTMFSF